MAHVRPANTPATIAAYCLANVDTTFICIASWSGSSRTQQRASAPCAVKNSSGRTRRMRPLRPRIFPCLHSDPFLWLGLVGWRLAHWFNDMPRTHGQKRAKKVLR